MAADPGVDVVQVITVIGDSSGADRLATLAVESGLAACAQVDAGVRSVYRWEGELHRDSEWRVVAKTSRDAAPELVARWCHEHPYDVPEVLVVPVSGGSPDYLDWVVEQVRRDDVD